MDLVDRWSLVSLKIGSMHVDVSLEVPVFESWGTFLGPKNPLKSMICRETQLNRDEIETIYCHLISRCFLGNGGLRKTFWLDPSVPWKVVKRRAAIAAHKRVKVGLIEWLTGVSRH